MSRFPAARVAATLRKELSMEVDLVPGRFGEFAVLVDGDVVAHSGAPSMIGIVPSAGQILRAVRARLSAAPRARS